MKKNYKSLITSLVAVFALLPSLTSCGFTYCQHKIETIKGEAATCQTTGIKSHYKCEFCGKYYSDAAGKTEVTAASLVVSAKGHSFGGYTSNDSNHWRACACGSTTDTGAHKYTLHGQRSLDGKFFL